MVMTQWTVIAAKAFLVFWTLLLFYVNFVTIFVIQNVFYIMYIILKVKGNQITLLL